MAAFETTAPDLKPLLGERISRLGLKLEGSPMERYVADLYRERVIFVPRARRTRTRTRPAAGLR